MICEPCQADFIGMQVGAARYWIIVSARYRIAYIFKVVLTMTPFYSCALSKAISVTVSQQAIKELRHSIVALVHFLRFIY